MKSKCYSFKFIHVESNAVHLLLDKQGDRYFHVKKTIPLYIGGLIGAYSMNKVPVLLEKARELADILLPAFNMETGSVCVWFRPNQKEV